ncbi:MAG: M23 family metallopeptidase [Bdellovibrionales bacterium]|nr:M23 family metallopeptidase [Bdellovibrionales bacterium]
MNIKTISVIFGISLVYILFNFLTVREPQLPPGAKIASDFGSRTDALGRKRRRKHQGIDIIGPVGTEIIAIADGNVLAAEDESCWGLTIMIDHSVTGKKPLMALYGHLDEMLVKENESVKRGQLIGRLGDKATKRKCVRGIRHLHLQLGRKIQAKEKKSHYWGYSYFLEDKKGLNPHHFWAHGPGIVTCFVPGINYPKDKITWPLHCKL